MPCYHLNLLLHQLQIDRFIDSIGCTLIHFCSRTPFFLILPEPVVRSTKKASCSSARGDSTPTEQIIESSMPASDSYLCKGLGLMNFPPPTPQCSKEAFEGLCLHCPAIVFVVFPVGHIRDFLTLLQDLTSKILLKSIMSCSILWILSLRAVEDLSAPRWLIPCTLGILISNICTLVLVL